MSVNSSSSSNASLPFSPPSPSPSITIYFFMHNCLISTFGTFSVTALTITSILVLFPVCFFVLYLGHQRWRQQRSSMPISHTDLFTYHMVFTELLTVFGFTLICCAVHTDLQQMIKVGLFFSSMNIYGQIYFHVLTCLERYLAVVHPITYLSLRKAKWIKIRNITIGCVWLLCFAGTGLMYVVEKDYITIIIFVVIAFVLIVISYCCISVLCVLIRPGPGEGGGGRQQVDQTKLRTFYTIMAILGVLLIRFGGYTLATSVYASLQMGDSFKCVIWSYSSWLSLPSSLVLPLLFLQRAGKLLCCKSNNKSGQGSN